MDSEPLASAPDSSPPTIRCLHCDYDLRGLPNDPIRCPECGRYTSYAEFERRRARRSKAGFYSTWAAIVFPVLCLTIPASIAMPACAGCGLLPMVILWLVLFEGVSREAGGSPAWSGLFLKHQLVVFPLILVTLACVPVCVGAVALVIRVLDSSGLPHGIRELAAAAISTLVVGLIATGFLAAVERLGDLARDLHEKLNRCAPREMRDPERTA